MRPGGASDPDVRERSPAEYDRRRQEQLLQVGATRKAKTAAARPAARLRAGRTSARVAEPAAAVLSGRDRRADPSPRAAPRAGPLRAERRERRLHVVVDRKSVV